MTDHRPPDRLYFLDSLRGLAAVHVVLFHTLLVTQRPLVLAPGLKQVVEFGGTGVFLFFVISGFSLSMTMPRHLATGRPGLSYSISRLFRIAPLFYAVFGVMVIPLIFSSSDRWSVDTVLLNCLFLFNLAPGQQTGVVLASWTIGVEMLFYAAFPFLYRMGIRRQIVALILSQIAFGVMLVVLPRQYDQVTVVGWLPLFFIGMWAHPILYGVGGGFPGKRRLGWALVAMALAVLAICALPGSANERVPLRVPIALGYAAILVGLGLQAPGTLGHPLLRFLGRISYSLYLLHAQLIATFDGWLAPLTRTMDDNVAYGVRVVAVLAALIPLAWLTNSVIEQPMEKHGKALFDRLKVRPVSGRLAAG